MLRLDRLRALADVYPGVEREDEMVAAAWGNALSQAGALGAITGGHFKS